jgi:hypothetical protein
MEFTGSLELPIGKQRESTAVLRGDDNLKPVCF